MMLVAAYAVAIVVWVLVAGIVSYSLLSFPRLLLATYFPEGKRYTRASILEATISASTQVLAGLAGVAVFAAFGKEEFGQLAWPYGILCVLAAFDAAERRVRKGNKGGRQLFWLKLIGSTAGLIAGLYLGATLAG